MHATLALLAATSLSSPVFAGQLPITFQICDVNNNCNYNSFLGAAEDAKLHTGNGGTVNEAQDANNGNTVNDAYDGYGYLYGLSAMPSTGNDVGNDHGYATDFNGLTGTRQTESYESAPGLAANSVRWFDSFTNTTGTAITANIAFGGNLGSDSDTHIHGQGDGYYVTGQSAPGNQSTDPVIAHLYGNNAYAVSQVKTIVTNGDDDLYFVFPITVAAGQTVSIMNVNVLFGSANRDNDSDGSIYAADVAEAILKAKFYVNSPIFAGLTAAQIETIINWDNIVVDGSLPSPGAVASVSGSMLGMFNDLLDGNSMFAQAGITPPATGISALGYASDGRAASPAVAQLVNMISNAGGKISKGDDEARFYFLGGYTNGSNEDTTGTIDFNGYALGAGVEFSPSASTVVGVAGGYAHSSGSMDNIYPDLGSDQFIFNPYARWTAPTGTVIDARLSVAKENWDYQRTAGAGTADADIDGVSMGARLAASQPIETSFATVTPFTHLSYLHTSVDGYTETGAGTANLEVPSYDVNTLELFGGVGLSKGWDIREGVKATAFVTAGLGGQLLGGDSILTRYTTSPTNYVSTIDTDTGIFGRVQLGGAFQVTQASSVAVSYTGTFKGGDDQHTVTAGLAVKF